MNETSNPSNERPAPEGQPQPTPPPCDQAQPQRPRDPLDRLRSAFDAGARRARTAAEDAAPKIKAAAADAAYWLAFGISYAAVFSYVVARELTPSPVKAGCHDGAAAGKTAGEHFAAETFHSQPPAAATSTPGPGVSPPPAPAGGA